MPMTRNVCIILGASIACGLVIGSACSADESAAVPAGVTLTREIQYRDGGSAACKLDLAMPSERGDSRRPAIVVIHGGGWLEGDKSSFTTLKTPGNILGFAKLGFVAVTINYRLSREAPYPAALEDCRCAVRWLRAHADEYRIDPQRIGAWGNSAGGHLALLLAMTERAPGTKDGEPYSEFSSRVQSAVSDSGPLDLAYEHTQRTLHGVIEKFMGGLPEGELAKRYREASPSYLISDNIPPLLLIYGEEDQQVHANTADRFVEDLSRTGHRDVSYVRLAGVNHCPHSLIRIPYLQQVVDEFFVRTLKLQK